MNEMGFEVRNLRQSSFTRRQRNDGGTGFAVAAEGHDQDRRGIVAQIPTVQRYDQYPMALRSILQVGGPDFSPPRLRARDQSRYLSRCWRALPRVDSLLPVLRGTGLQNRLRCRWPAVRDFRRSEASARPNRSRQPRCERRHSQRAVPDKREWRKRLWWKSSPGLFELGLPCCPLNILHIIT